MKKRALLLMTLLIALLGFQTTIALPSFDTIQLPSKSAVINSGIGCLSGACYGITLAIALKQLTPWNALLTIPFTISSLSVEESKGAQLTNTLSQCFGLNKENTQNAHAYRTCSSLAATASFLLLHYLVLSKNAVSQ